jgi:hypothetical protein
VAERESPLESAAEIYRPFDAAEVKRLRAFVADVEGLSESALFTDQTNVFKISGEINQPIKQELEYPGEEAIHAAVGRFRSLYNSNELTSYSQILKLLGRHAHEHESPRQREALDALKDLRKWEGEALAESSGIEINFNGEVLTAPVLIDMFFHGHYLHKGNDLSDKLDAFPLRGLLLSEFIRAMQVLMRVYWVGRNVVAQILETPSLLPQATPVGSGS